MSSENKPSREPAISRTISHQIYGILKQDIMTHQISPGDKLVNRKLQERFEVSSTPIRDAINRLYMDGLVDDITNVGARVVTVDKKYLLEIMEVTNILSRGALTCTAKAGNLQTMCERMEAIFSEASALKDMAEFVRLDSLFHSALFDYCEVAELQKLHARCAALVELITWGAYVVGTKSMDFAAAHRPIYEACRREDLDGAFRALDKHYDDKRTENLAGV